MIDTLTKKELIVYNHNIEQIKHFLEVELLCHISIKGMIFATNMRK